MIETLLGEELENLLTDTTPNQLAVRCADELGEHPVLIAIDDAQWLDATSEAFLAQLMLAPTIAPLTIVLIHRIGHEPAVLRSAARRRGAVHEHFTLQALPDTAISELVSHLPAAQAEEVVRVAKGNPLFARTAESGFSRHPAARKIDEVLRLEEGSQSAVLNAVITDDIEALSPAAKTMLHTMAILGPDSTPELVQQLTGVDEETHRATLAELKIHGLVDPNPHQTLHPVVRYSAYLHTPTEWRIHVHREAARHLAGERLKQAEHLGHIAAHLEPAEIEVLVEAAAIALGTQPQAVLRWLTPIVSQRRTETTELLLARAEILTGKQIAAIARLRALHTHSIRPPRCVFSWPMRCALSANSKKPAHYYPRGRNSNSPIFCAKSLISTACSMVAHLNNWSQR